MTVGQNEIQTLQHSEEVHDILTEIPGWTIKWGISVIFFVVMVLIALSWFFKYPDVVVSRVTLTSTQPPIGVVANMSGPMEMFKRENDFVKKGDIIGLIKSSASYEDIVLLKKNLNIMPELYDLNENWQLGEIQPYFNELIINLKKKKNTAALGTQTIDRKKLISQQILEYNKILKQTKRKISLYQKDYEYARKLLRSRYMPLYEKDIISREEYEGYAFEATEQYKKIEGSKVEINEIQNRILSLKKEKQGLDFDQTNQSTETTNQLDNAYTQLKGRLSIWEQKYLLKSPITGSLTYLDFAKDNMFLEKDKEVAMIVPSGGGIVYGEMFLPQENLGKVEIGQMVHLELDHYQKREFGILEGEVKSIAPISQKNGYKAIVELPKNLKTGANKTLEFNHGMEGNARVITQDIRLIHRLFYQIREALKG